MFDVLKRNNSNLLQTGMFKFPIDFYRVTYTQSNIGENIKEELLILKTKGSIRYTSNISRINDTFINEKTLTVGIRKPNDDKIPKVDDILIYNNTRYVISNVEIDQRFVVLEAQVEI